MIDKLSGLLERKPFTQKFDEEVKRAVRYHRAVSLLMIDLDHNHFSKEVDVRWSLGYSLLGYVFATQITQVASLIGNAIGFILAGAVALGLTWFLLRSWTAEKARQAT